MEKEYAADEEEGGEGEVEEELLCLPGGHGVRKKVMRGRD